MSRRIALKYCGGCDPAFDRVELFRRIEALAGDRVEWVGVDDGAADAVLLIGGCARACPAADEELARHRMVIVSAGGDDLSVVLAALLG